ncbi:MAG: hypothetical protein Q9O74_05325 [Planctomycetota bacterium]|nr:hypothetical protein [Planctomycetota bacterium]
MFRRTGDPHVPVVVLLLPELHHKCLRLQLSGRLRHTTCWLYEMCGELNVPRHTVVWLLVGVIALAFAIMTYMRAAPTPNTHALEAERLVDAAQSGYSELPITQWTVDASAAEAKTVSESIVDSFHFTIAAQARPAFSRAQGQLVRDVQGFLETAIIDRDLAAYKQWRRSRGDVLRSMDDMNRSWFIVQDWQQDFGEEPPPNPDAETAFDRHWDRWFEAAGSGGLPVGIAESPDGLECAVGIVDSIAGDKRPQLLGSMGRAGWTGGRGGTCRVWWTHERNGHMLLKEYGKVLCAEVGMVIEYGNGGRHPLVTSWVLDPAMHQWRLEYVCVYNWDVNKLVRSMEY